MPFISKTNKTRRGRMTTRRNVPSNRSNRVSIPTTTTSRVSVAKPMVSAIRKIANSAVRKEAETKFCSVSNDQSFNSTISAASECYPLMPRIGSGTQDFQRVGDRVNGRYLYIKGHIQYNSSYIDLLGANYTPPSTVRILILTQKNIKASGQLTNVDVNHLLKDNVATGTARAYVGTMTDNLAPINRDLFKVYMDKKVRMKVIQQFTDGTGSSSIVGLPTVYFRCRIKLPNTLTFDDGNGDYPNNFAPFLCVGSVCDDGSGPFTTSTPYRVTWLSTAYYDDA